MNEPQTLRSLVRRALDARGASGRQLAALAQGHGFRVTATTINHIAAGTYKSEPKPETIRAIAWLAGVTEEVAFAAAGVPMPGPPFSEELPPGVDNLSPRSRRAAVEVLRALVEAEQEAGGEHDQRSAPMNQAEESSATESNVERALVDQLASQALRGEVVERGYTHLPIPMTYVRPDEFETWLVGERELSVEQIVELTRALHIEPVPAGQAGAERASLTTLDGELVDPDDHVLAARDADDDAEVEAQQEEP